MSKKKEPIVKTQPKIKHLSWLSRIDLSEEEEILFSSELEDILSLFKQIDKVLLTDIEPTYHAILLNNIWRPDEVEPSMSEEILKNVPLLKGRYLKAPRMG